MPNTKSAIRRVRRVKKQTLTNRLRKSKYRSIIREINLLISAKKKKRRNQTTSKVKFTNYENCKEESNW